MKWEVGLCGIVFDALVEVICAYLLYCALSLIISDAFFKVVIFQCIYMDIYNFFEMSLSYYCHMFWICVVCTHGA